MDGLAWPDGLPQVIQGGMGVAISDWRLAGTVAAAGQLGVVSGTALEMVCARRLQLGDPGGHVRWALTRFPVPRIAREIMRTYYIHGGKPAGAPFRPVPRFTERPSRKLAELTVAANFVEVALARRGHAGAVGVNYLRKIELPLPYACYGALLAGVDAVLVGAGNPADLPPLLDRLARHEPVELPFRIQGATGAAGDAVIRFDPRELLGDGLPELRRPRFLAIVASVDLATALAADPRARPDGFVIEGYVAGGHNAPPRGPRRLDELGQPVYDARDAVTPEQFRPIGLPYWMAGSYGTPRGLARALAGGAAGVQVGTAFALCHESGMAPELKRLLLTLAAAGPDAVVVRTDARASPTGFPFKVVQLPGTLSDSDVYAARPRLCDLGALRSAYLGPDGRVRYRCPAEPVEIYVGRRGGRPANTVGRRCICNGLLATAGFAQVRAGGQVEPPIVTAGDDFTGVRELLDRYGPAGYPAAAVLTYLLNP